MTDYRDEKDALLALRGRLVEAAATLDEMVPKNVLESDLWRISGKAEGVRLALSYVDEALRFPPEQGTDRGCEQKDEYDQIEYGVRFLPPHRNAGEAVWLPDVVYAARMVLDTPGMAELVERQVGPWTRVIPPGKEADSE